MRIQYNLHNYTYYNIIIMFNIFFFNNTSGFRPRSRSNAASKAEPSRHLSRPGR